MNQTNIVQIATLALAGWLGTGLLCARAAPNGGVDQGDGKPTEPAAATVIQVRDSLQADPGDKPRAWLGVAVEEAPEALSAQLGLDPGVGLVVLHVSPDSPAAKAGLTKHDVLVELAGHPLAHPAQLRRLVQARQPGETVEVVIYRAGKRQKVSAALGKAPPTADALEDWGDLRGSLRELKRQLGELRWGDLFHDYVKRFHEQWGRFSTEQGEKILRDIQSSLEQARQALQEAIRRMSNAQPRIQAQIERSMEQARDAIEEAARQMSNAWHSLQRPTGPLKDLLKGGVRVDKNASVVVRSRGDTVRSIVKSDDWGTVIILGPPLRLTARDRDGNLVFEGEIETPEQRAKVPPELWERVQPLLDDPPAPRPLPKSQPGRRPAEPGTLL